MLAQERIKQNNKLKKNIWTQTNFNCVKRRIEQITAKMEVVIAKAPDYSYDENARY
jgi:hypothetical protein